MPSLASQHLLPRDTHARVEDWILRDDEDPPRFYKKLLADQSSNTQTAQLKDPVQNNADATLPAVGGCSSSHLAGTNPIAPGDEKLDRYERRMRHKTKDDRYDYKKTKVQKKLERLSKHLRRAIAHKFHAPNVAQDRLTINHRPDLGIFKKGKTSSPIKSKVPILGFSEEDFLAGKPQRIIPRNDVSETYFASLPDHDTADTTRCEMQNSVHHEDHWSQYGTDGRNEKVLIKGMRSPRTAVDLSSDPDLESYTKSLLRVNFLSPNKATTGIRLWTLEDLHRLLRERETLWDSGKNDTQSPQRSRVSLTRGFLKRISSSSPIRTTATAPMPPKKIQKTGKGHAIQQQHRDSDIRSRAKMLSANHGTPSENAHRQEESMPKVITDWITPTKSSKYILSRENGRHKMPEMPDRPDSPYFERKDEVCRPVSCEAQSNSMFVTSSGPNEIIDDCFPLSPSKVDYAALEAACDAILATESDFFQPRQDHFKEISTADVEPGIPTRKPESALEGKPSASDSHEDTHGYANDDRTHYYNTEDRSGKPPASDAVRDVPLSRYLRATYNGGLFTENEIMQTRADFTTHTEGCLECRLRQGYGSHCEPTGLQIDISDDLEGFWQRRMLY